MSRRRPAHRDPPAPGSGHAGHAGHGDDVQRATDARTAEFLRLVTSLADRMDTMTAGDLDGSRARTARIRVLRHAADAARRSLRNGDGDRDDGTRDARSTDKGHQFGDAGKRCGATRSPARQRLDGPAAR